jgi:hypothetical protein
LGYPFPVRSWRSLNAQPFRYSCRCSCPRKRLLGRSSPGLRSSYTVFPVLSGRGLPTYDHLSWGLLPLQRIRKRESTSRPVARPGSPVLPGYRLQVPPCRLRRRSQVLSTSQRLLPPSAVLPCFRQVALVGFALQGFAPLAKTREALHSRRALLTFLPLVALPPS